jgi:hypothetical protein
MPVPKVLLSVPHQLQEGDGDCLAACAAMVLAHLGRAIEYARLLRLLDIKPYGAPAGNIRRWPTSASQSYTAKPIWQAWRPCCNRAIR